jgi:hypothetical protein
MVGCFPRLYILDYMIQYKWIFNIIYRCLTDPRGRFVIPEGNENIVDDTSVRPEGCIQSAIAIIITCIWAWMTSYLSDIFKTIIQRKKLGATSRFNNRGAIISINNTKGNDTSRAAPVTRENRVVVWHPRSTVRGRHSSIGPAVLGTSLLTIIYEALLEWLW